MIVDEIPTVVNNTVSDCQNETLAYLTNEKKTVSSNAKHLAQPQSIQHLTVNRNSKQDGSFLKRMLTMKSNKVQPVSFEGKEGDIIDDVTLKKKIDVLFEGQYNAELSARSKDGTRINAVEAIDEIIKWGETEFGLSHGEKEMISEIYEEIDNNVDSSFSKEELFRHLRDTQITPVRNRNNIDRVFIDEDYDSIEDEEPFQEIN